MKPGRPAAGVEYFSNATAPDLKFFACSPLRVTLSMKGCASRWREGQQATGHDIERFAVCRGCPIGAAHAGEDFIRYSPLHAAAICPRCRRGTTRMIQNRVCVSCRNREYELAKGENARGNVPVELMLAAPRPIAFRLLVNGALRRHRSTGVDLLEPMLQTLRTTKGEVQFAFAPPACAGPRQGRLL